MKNKAFYRYGYYYSPTINAAGNDSSNYSINVPKLLGLYSETFLNRFFWNCYILDLGTSKITPFLTDINTPIDVSISTNDSGGFLPMFLNPDQVSGVALTNPIISFVHRDYVDMKDLNILFSGSLYINFTAQNLSAAQIRIYAYGFIEFYTM